jgi:F-box and WD-40 domain protein 1/11
MHARQNVLAHRPKTSSALDDDSSRHTSSEHEMKRTASQSFTPAHYYEGRDTTARDLCVVLGALDENATNGDPQHSHSNSLSRAFSHTREKARRRLSSFSSTSAGPSRRRGSIQSLFGESLPSFSATRKSSIDQQRAPLQHQDSGIPSFPLDQAAESHRTSLLPYYHNPNKSSSTLFKRMSSMRRRPKDPDPSPPFHITPFPSQSPLLPGAAARQAAAAARELRSQRELEMEQTNRFINGQSPLYDRDGLLMDNESGIDMTCASDIASADSVEDKKMSMSCHRTLVLRHQYANFC